MIFRLVGAWSRGRGGLRRDNPQRRPCARRDPSVSAIALIAALRPIAKMMWQSPSFISKICGYGSRRSPGRRRTLDTPPPSRGAMSPSCAKIIRPRKQRAWGMPGARCTRSRAWCVVNTRVSHHGYTGSPGIPARNGFNGFLRALPGDRAWLSPSPTESLPPT
jgi:hypothetical protein